MTISLRGRLKNGGKCLQLAARWEFPEQVYEELALFGVDDAGRVAFWSFTSDGKRSHGVLAAAPHVHAEAIAFGAQRPSGAPDLLAGRGGRVLVGGGGVEDEGRLEPVRGAPLPGAGGAGGRAMLAWRELARPHANARDTKQHSERSRPAPHQAPSGLREAR